MISKYINNKNNVLFLIIFQSCGIRFFQGQGFFLSGVIILLLVKNFFYFKTIHLKILIFTALFLAINYYINEGEKYVNVIYQFLLITQSVLLLTNLKFENTFFKSFFLVVELFVINSLLGFLLYYIFSNFYQDVTYNNMPYKTLYNLFYISSFQGNIRNCGFFWEPSILQLFANIYLFFSIKQKLNNRVLIAIFVVISTFSTTGFVLIALNFLYYIYIKTLQTKQFYHTIYILLLSIMFASVAFENIKDKFNNENTSGLARLRDYYIGIELIKEKPILGHGFFDMKYLLSKQTIRNLEIKIFTKEYLETVGDMSGGYTNGLFSLFAWYGVPMGFFLFYWFFYNRILMLSMNERILFILMFVFTFFSVPITYTSFFFIFPISFFLIKK